MRAFPPKSRNAIHQAVTGDEYWYGDDPPDLGKSFTAAKTIHRHHVVIGILKRAAKREAKIGSGNMASSLTVLTDKLINCRPGCRCGSLACPQCARAFQRAKVAGQKLCIEDLIVRRSEKALLVTACVIPLWLKRKADQMNQLDIAGANRWLKAKLVEQGFDRVMLGSMDISLDEGFYQPHWHIAMWTSNRARLTERLKEIFPGQDRYDRPVVVKECENLGFLGYQNKGIKLPDLLRHDRRHLPYLLLNFDQLDPLDLMVLMRVRIDVEDGQLVFKRMG